MKKRLLGVITTDGCRYNTPEEAVMFAREMQKAKEDQEKSVTVVVPEKVTKIIIEFKE